MRKLETEIHIEQVRDGREYKGHIHFGDSYKFQYELTCDRNIKDLDELAGSDLEAAKSQMHLSLRDSEGTEVSIPEELALLFQGLVLPAAIEFYESPQTRDSQELIGLTGSLGFGASASIGMTRKCSFDGDKLEPVLAKYF